MINYFSLCTDNGYRKKRIGMLTQLKILYNEIGVHFFELAKEVFEFEQPHIFRMLFGRIGADKEIEEIIYSKLLFEMGEECLYLPDYSISANRRLIDQKGLFLVSGSGDRVATRLYYKLIVEKGSKHRILHELAHIHERKRITWNCPLKESTLKDSEKEKLLCDAKKCHDKGICYLSAYGDLYGQSEYIKKCEIFYNIDREYNISKKLTRCEFCETERQK